MDLAHLRPETRGLAMRPAVERIAEIKVDRWIGYTAAQGALAQLNELLEREPGRVRPHNLLVLGPTNNGKTMVAERFRRMHPSHMATAGNHEIVPVVMLQMPADPTIGRLVAVILAAMGSPIRFLRTAERCLQLTLRLLEVCETRMLILDEFHNLLGVPARRQRELLNFIRYLGNERRIPVVCLGTREAWLAVRADPQLENRFTPYLLPVWNDGSELARLLASFEACLPLREPSHLAANELRSEILRRSEGTIGEIATLVTRAAAVALSDGRERIDTTVLNEAAYDGPSRRRQRVDRVLR